MSDSQKWFYLTVASLLFVFLYLLAPILTPFMLGALLAYLGDPLADHLQQKRGYGRTAAVMIVFMLIISMLLFLFLVLFPRLEGEARRLVQDIPGYLNWIKVTVLPMLEPYLGVSPEMFSEEKVQAYLRESWLDGGGFVVGLLETLTQSGLKLLAWLANILLVPVVTFYLLRDWDVLLARLKDLLPRHIEPTVTSLAKESDQVLGAFIRGQLGVMLILGIIYTTGLWLLGLKTALMIGFFAALVSFVPYLGLVVGIVFASIAAVLQFQEFTPLIWVALIFGIGQLLEGTVLTPNLVGDKIGLHPVAVIFAVLAGGQLFGFFGILLALPVAAVVAVVLRHLHKRYLASDLYQPRDPAAAE